MAGFYIFLGSMLGIIGTILFMVVVGFLELFLPTRRYVGRVRWRAVILSGSNKSEFEGFWVLTKNLFGKREAKQYGHRSRSDCSEFIKVEAQVETWVAGGPLPELESD